MDLTKKSKTIAAAMLARNNNFEISINNIVLSLTTWGLLHISIFLLSIQHYVICNFIAQNQKGPTLDVLQF